MKLLKLLEAWFNPYKKMLEGLHLWFCEILGCHDLEGLVVKFQNCVSFGVSMQRLWSWLIFHMLRKLIPQHKVIIVTCHFVDVSKFLVNTPEITIVFIISFVRFLSKDTL